MEDTEGRIGWGVPVFAFALFVLLLVPLPFEGRLLHNLGDLLHAPVFALLAVMLFRVARRRVGWSKPLVAVACWLVATTLGLLIEYLQSLTGRHASWQDAWADGWGALAGLLWENRRAIRSPIRRRGLTLAAAAALLIASARPVGRLIDIARQHAEMPTLASFESYGEMSRWNWRECEVRRVKRFATAGDWSLRVDLLPGQYPGVALVHPVSDWTAYGRLALDVRLDDGSPLNLVVKIKDIETDYEENDWFHHLVRLQPGINRVRVDLDDLVARPSPRRLRADHVEAVSLFTVSPDRGRTIWVDALRLEPGAERQLKMAPRTTGPKIVPIPRTSTSNLHRGRNACLLLASTPTD